MPQGTIGWDADNRGARDLPDETTCAAANIVLGDNSPMESPAEEANGVASSSGSEWYRGGCS